MKTRTKKIIGILLAFGAAVGAREECHYRSLKSEVPSANSNDVQKAHVVIVFTGKGDRINTGFSIVRPGQFLHISGCPPAWDNELAPKHMPFKKYPHVRDNFSFDHARDTLENARETVKLMRKRGLKSAIIVVPDYHAGRCADLMNKEMKRQNFLADIKYYIIPANDYIAAAIERVKLIKKDAREIREFANVSLSF